VTHIPAHARGVYDVTGAGDTVISALTMALAAGAKTLEAAKISNAAAGVVVGKVGTATVTPEELRQALNKETGMEKIKTLAEMAILIDRLREQKKKIVFTNGCFDLLHIGHIRYLLEAKTLGDVLIVGLNTDHSVKSIKGDKRPIVPEEERAEILAALDCIDYVVPFSEPTPDNIISMLKPDLLIKGGDYRLEDIPEACLVKSYGGEVIILPGVEGHSTSTLVNHILERYSK